MGKSGWLLYGIVFLAAVAVGPGAAQDMEPQVAPLNPAFAEHIQELEQGTVQIETEEEYSLGFVPPPLDLSHTSGQPIFGACLALPSSYDLRTLGNKLTAIKDQASCGTCWAFATYGSAESCLLPLETWNFSENNLKNKSGFDWNCCYGGGNYNMSTAYLARWAGPVNESEDPYNTSNCTSPSGLTPKKHVQQVIFVPDRSDPLDNDTIKQAVMTYGAVGTSFYYGNTYYNSTTHSYYYSGAVSSNHAVCIVGWNDNYPASNFNSIPAGNGAFIVRNSWGTGWGENGYFYVSYYDSKFGKDNGLFVASESTSNYYRVYQYDPLGWIGGLGYGNTTAWFANVFTAVSADPLTAVSWYSASPNSTYQLYVYQNPTSGPIDPGGPVATKTGTITSPGYNTVSLDSLVPLTNGQKFSVVVGLTTPDYTYPIPWEYPISGYSSGATSSPGQSYISAVGTTWQDITTFRVNSNVCLKAFAGQAQPMSVTPATDLTSTGSVGGLFTPSSQSYIISNPDSAPIDWTATHSPSAAWLTVSPASGTLSGGAQVTVTVSINSNANTLPAGAYADTVAFTNTTNGLGNTTRAVSLTVLSSQGQLTVTPTGGFSSLGPVGGPFTPDRLAYTLSNIGDSAIDFTVTHGISQNWLTLYCSLPGHQSTVVTTMVNSLAAALDAGVHTDTVTFANLTNGQGNTTRTAQITVSGTGTLQVTPADGLSSSGQTGGPFTPLSKQYMLTNTGTASLNWTASHTPSATWVTLSSSGGTLASGASTMVTVSINSNANLLPAGTYNDTVTFTNVTFGAGNTTRPIQLTVAGTSSGHLEVAPADGFASSGPIGGPFSPVSKQYTLTNTGAASFQWSVSHNPAVTWVTLTNTSGSLSPGASATVTVSINSTAAWLQTGTYADTVSFVNITTGSGDTTRDVELSVVTRTLSSVSVYPTTLGCPSTDPRQIHATAYFSDSTSADITSLGTWTSSNPAVATIGSDGAVHPIANGTATMTCTYTYGGATRSGACLATVSFQRVLYLYVSPTGYVFRYRSPKQFSCLARLGNSSWLTVTDQCQWSSSNTNVFTVDQRGVVTPIAIGQAYLIATYIYNGAPLMDQELVKVQ